MKEYIEIKEELQARVLEEIDYSKEASDEEILSIIDQIICKEKYLRIWRVEERKLLARDIFYALRRWDFLQGLLEDSTITEIMINGASGIYIEKNGKLEKYQEKVQTPEKLRDIIQRIVAGCNRVVNASSPIVDARLDNGARVNVVLDPVAINGPIITIRRFPDKAITMEELILYNSISQEAASFLRAMVQAGYNIFISGGTGAGKTTFLNVLSNFIPGGERVITIEDSAELQIQGIENLVRLETRNENLEGCSPISIRELIKTSLRMRPDRIIVGEVRGSEAMDMMQCLNTGHDGSMSTGHGNSARDMLSRLETMILMGIELPLPAIRQQIAAGIDVIVHLGRVRDKSRKVLEICEVDGYVEGEIKIHTLFSYQEIGESKEGKVKGNLVREGELIHDEKFKAAGIPIP